MPPAPVRVVVVGGGTAGWMTAAALSTALQRQPCTVILVESNEIGTVGVGEATIPTIHWFNQMVGLDEAEFLRETKATFKLGIRFRGWTGEGSDYFHPFGTFGLPGDAQLFPHRLIRGWNDGLQAPASDFSLTAQAALRGRFTRPGGGPRSLLSTTPLVDGARRLAVALRRPGAGPGSLLLVGTPDHEPWHLTAHLDEEARYAGLPDLSPTLVRWQVPDGAPPHLAVDLQRQAFSDLPYLPLGQYYNQTSFKPTITGVLAGVPVFWNVRKG